MTTLQRSAGDAEPGTIPRFPSAAAFYDRCTAGRGVRLVAALAFAIAALGYLGWRATVLNPHAPIFSAVFYAAECFGALSVALSVFTFWSARRRAPAPAPEGLSVDVLVPTYNEPIDVVRRTALAATRIRYPHETWILDDGARDEVRALAGRLGCRYLARTDNRHAKAGNLNNALAHCTGEFVAILDADHVPEPHFLDALLGYFGDASIGFVQSPQDYYNVDSIQFHNDEARRVLWHDQTLFYGIGEAGRDRWNAVTFCGTSSVVRRAALDAVGGFATETVTEDMHTAVRMQALGWASAFHPEPLAYGIGATGFVEYLQQRLRWGHGNVQVLREEHVPWRAGLGLAQRVCYSALGISYFEGWARLVLYLTPAIALLSGVAPIGDTPVFFWYFVPYMLLSWLVIDEFGRGDARVVANEQMAMARFPIFALATLGLVRGRTRFRVTSKERIEGVPVPLLAPQAIVLVLSVAAILQGVVAPSPALLERLSGGTVSVIVFWAGVNALLAWSVIARVTEDSRRAAGPPRFEIPLPVRYAANGSQPDTTTVAKSVSEESVTFTAPIDSAPRIGDRLCVEIHVPGTVLACHGEVAGTRRASGASLRGSVLVDCTLEWSDADPPDELALALRACGWHRALWWNGKPRTLLASLARTVASRGGEGRVRWQAGLCRIGGARARLCVSSPDVPGTVALFEEVAPGREVSIEMALPGARPVSVVHARIVERVGSAGIGGVEVRLFRLETVDPAGGGD